MSWLRIDDSFMQHPKFSGWKSAQKWALLELMGYCAKYRTDGRVPNDLALLPRSVTPALIALAERSGWLDRDEDGALWIHDWSVYNPKDATAASRAKAYRDRNANRDENRDATRDETVTSRARDPVPSPTPEVQEQKQDPSPSTNYQLPARERTEPITHALQNLDWSKP